MPCTAGILLPHPPAGLPPRPSNGQVRLKPLRNYGRKHWPAVAKSSDFGQRMMRALRSGTAHSAPSRCGRTVSSGWSDGPVAQRSEQATHNRLVGGSNPSRPIFVFGLGARETAVFFAVSACFALSRWHGFNEHATASRKTRRHSRTTLATVADAGVQPRYFRSRYHAMKRRALSGVILLTIFFSPRCSFKKRSVRTCPSCDVGARSPRRSRYILANSASVTAHGSSALATRIAACRDSAYLYASFRLSKLLL